MRILVGFGGNVGDVELAFARAAAALARHTLVVGRSGLWCSTPVGPPQPRFWNAVMALEWERHPLELLALCQCLESAAGRDRGTEPRWGPRPLDLDLLIAPQLVMTGPSLELPHPSLHQRRFALLPACELAPELLHPRLHATLAELTAALDPGTQPCSRLGPFPA
jgi:2-amino-4-hydroxy-6-hydroxymethyldihydropteridine diphosphokinase